MRQSPVRSDEEAVEVWLRDYSGKLLSVGIKLGLTAAQQTELQTRLVSRRQGVDAITGIRGSFCSNRTVRQPENDPMKMRWFDEQGDQARQTSRDA
jgi:hypothetical protein